MPAVTRGSSRASRYGSGSELGAEVSSVLIGEDVEMLDGLDVDRDEHVSQEVLVPSSPPLQWSPPAFQRDNQTWAFGGPRTRGCGRGGSGSGSRSGSGSGTDSGSGSGCGSGVGAGVLIFSICPTGSLMTFSDAAYKYHYETIWTDDVTVIIHGCNTKLLKHAVNSLQIQGLRVSPSQFRDHVLNHDDYWRAGGALKAGVIPQHDGRIMLRGQLCAVGNIKQGIKIGEIVCPYTGLVLMESEANKLEQSSRERLLFDSYALKGQAYKGQAVISALPPYGSIGGLVNDFRYISPPPPIDSNEKWKIPTKTDPRNSQQNVSYIEFEWNGGSHMFLIAIRDIAYGSEAIGDYGRSYWIDWMAQQRLLVLV